MNSSECTIVVVLYSWQLPKLALAQENLRKLIASNESICKPGSSCTFKAVSVKLCFARDDTSTAEQEKTHAQLDLGANRAPSVLMGADEGKSWLLDLQVDTVPSVYIGDGKSAVVSEALSASLIQLLYVPAESTVDHGSHVTALFDGGLEAYNNCDFDAAAEKFDAIVHYGEPNNETCWFNCWRDARDGARDTACSSSTSSAAQNALFNLSSMAHMFGYPSVALGLVHSALLLSPSDMVMHAYLWTLANTTIESQQSATDSSGGSEADPDSRPLVNLAIRTYEHLHRCTDSTLALHKLIALRGVTADNIVAASNNPSYAATLYDDMAGAFENKLVGSLEYRAPWTMRDLVAARLKKQQQVQVSGQGAGAGVGAPRDHVLLLDLGCGSGLIGRLFYGMVKGKGVEAADGEDEVQGGGAKTEPANSSEEVQMEGSGAVAAAMTDATIPLEDVIGSIRRLKHESDGENRESGLSGGSGTLIGVDISPGILKVAASHPRAYDHCYCLDVKQVLAQTAAAGGEAAGGLVDVVVAADTFIYLGLLGDIFAAARKVLVKPSEPDGRRGLFCFTIENLDNSPMKRASTAASSAGGASSQDSGGSVSLPNEPFAPTGAGASAPLVLQDALQLLTSARFAHSTAYIAALCHLHGFEVLEDVDIVLRKEGSVPLSGKIYLLQVA